MTMPREKTNERATAAVDRASRSVPVSATVTIGDVARHAYDLYLARGGEHGHDLDDWLQAERELRAAFSTTTRH
jgi:Protein of unknown function (DUF2934)